MRGAPSLHRTVLVQLWFDLAAQPTLTRSAAEPSMPRNTARSRAWLPETTPIWTSWHTTCNLPRNTCRITAGRPRRSAATVKPTGAGPGAAGNEAWPTTPHTT